MEYGDEMFGVHAARDHAANLGSLTVDNIGMLDAVDLPIIVISRDCKVAHVNRAATTVFGLKALDIGRSPGIAYLLRGERG